VGIFIPPLYDEGRDRRDGLHEFSKAPPEAAGPAERDAVRPVSDGLRRRIRRAVLDSGPAQAGVLAVRRPVGRMRTAGYPRPGSVKRTFERN